MFVRARALAVSFAIVSTLVACASSTPGANPDDAGVFDARVEPPDARLTPVGAGFDETCETSSDCAAGICYRPAPSAPGHCSRTCDGNCPDGFQCQLIRIDNVSGIRICVPAPDTMCQPCTTHEQCGDDGDACVQLTDGKFCTIECTGNPTVCPAGFVCAEAGVGADSPIFQCMPRSGICCLDADRDDHGVGGGCLGSDCNDSNPNVYEGHAEVCDSLDNDCDTRVDVPATDCQPASCELTGDGYMERAAQPCDGVQCVVQPLVSCGLYTCDGGGENGDACARDCRAIASDDDGTCVQAAHCDDGTCLADLADGQVCDENSDCISNHCQNGFCCSSGNCCQVAADCSNDGVPGVECDNPTQCQGTRGAAVCRSNFTCSTDGTAQDDSDCTPTTQANDCGLYRPVFCTGAVDQTPPVCPTSCDDHGDCDESAWCNPQTHTCTADLDDGQACGAEDERCTNDHCQNGFCCATGDCCAQASDCPAGYSSPAVCSSPASCDGDADVAVCIASMCGTADNVDDDSACAATTRASDCGPYRPVFCTGSSTQQQPECLDSCTSDSECDGNAYCNRQGQCVPDQADGGVCEDAGECVSGHCENGHCCQDGFCCATGSDCDSFDQPPVCGSPASCQGTRIDGVCSASHACTTTTVQDDSGCGGIPASDCGPYPPQVCTSAPSQSPPVCPSACTDDSGCDLSAHCDAGQCAADTGPGGFCDEPSDCGGNLFCVDNVCCNAACNGSCEACDLPGSLGTCTAVPSGQDPDNECGQVSCAAYYAGYQGNFCMRKADVAANRAACDGSRACRPPAEECAAQTAAGAMASQCHDECQDPTPGTCTGTVPGACSNVNPGTQSCGVGECVRTAPICQNGAPATCTPGSPQPETCNDRDDNCDGALDNGAFSDSYEPNPGCDAAYELGSVGSDQGNAYEGMTVYGSGDLDYYKIRMEESDDQCYCAWFDENYMATVELTVPAGGGSYVLCMRRDGCGFETADCVEIAAGETGSLSQRHDGACFSSDRYDMFVEVRGDNAPAFECRPYTLRYSFDAGLCDE